MKVDCHEHAVRCALQSFHARNADERELYLKMALLWLELARVEGNPYGPKGPHGERTAKAAA